MICRPAMAQSLRCARRCLTVKYRFAFKLRQAQMSSYEIRRKFIDFFQQQYNHDFVPSSSVKLLSDPTLLFVNAGMNQFKPRFLEIVDPNDKMWALERAVNSQKCIRAGGKHNDLEDVGKDTSHHTFFEMLGSWSFGDYFKEKACKMALELLTEHFNLPVSRLYFTYFGGNSELGLDMDTDTRDIWISLGIPRNNIAPFGIEDNFWEMGDKGPCGPCTEIHYDYAGNRQDLINTGHPDVVEIWNIVFMQYNRLSSSKLLQLPTYHVDTGMGLERISAILQGKKSNYDTDLFLPILNKIEEVCNCTKYQGLHSSIDQAYRIISDHIRMLVISISDHVYPGNVGAELILRRVLRRAYLCSKQMLHAPDGLLCQLVPIVINSLSPHYSYLNERQAHIIKIIENEEKNFINILLKGERIFNKTIKNIGKQTFPLETAILLHNHYGYPLDMLIENIKENGLIFDIEKFNKYQNSREELKQSGREIKDRETKVNIEITSNVINDMKLKNVPFSDMGAKHDAVRNEDRSYQFPTMSSILVSIVSDQGNLVESVQAGQRCALIFAETCFYHVDGGQIADVGSVNKHGMEMFSVLDVTHAGGYTFHHGYCSENCEGLKLGDNVQLSIDSTRRQACMRAHTAAHLLNYACREIIGPDIIQQGSKIDEDCFRLTLNGPTPTSSNLHKVIQAVRSQISSDQDVAAKNVVLNEALNDKNIRRLRDNVYCDPARIISIGSSLNNNHSVELCGGTHVHKTGDIKQFTILSSKSQGMNRTTIKCLTGKSAEKSECYLADIQARVHNKVEQSKNLILETKSTVPECAQMKNDIGQLNYEVITADILTICKSDMKEKLRDQSQKLSTKIKKLKKGN